MKSLRSSNRDRALRKSSILLGGLIWLYRNTQESRLGMTVGKI